MSQACLVTLFGLIFPYFRWDFDNCTDNKVM